MDYTGRQSAGNEGLAWLAGFLDGEGTICLASRPTNAGVRYLPLVTITNTHHETIERIAEIFTENGVAFHVVPYSSKKYKRAKRIYTIHIAGMQRVTRVLDLITPFLFTKRKQAEVVHGFIQYRLSLDNKRAPYGETEFSILRELKNMNAFGSSETLRVAAEQG